MIKIMKKTKRISWLLVLSSIFFLAACGGRGGDLLRAERPRVTSTPSGTTQKPLADSITAGAAGVSVPSGEATPVPPELLASLSTEEQLRVVTVPTRDLRDLALRLRPGIDEIPLVADDTSGYSVGARAEFWVHNSNSNSNAQITAELVYQTEVVHAWVEVDQSYDHDALAASIDQFSEVSYPAERAFFGSEVRPGIDNDPRLHVLHSIGIGSGVAGYFSSADEYSKLANPFSNEKEMFYINLNWFNRNQDPTSYETVLAHEFQHMVHWANDRNEDSWINEGLSEFAQEVAGYAPDTNFARVFSNQPDTQLNTWNEITGGNAEHYGSAYLFVAYFAQRFGPEVTRALVAHPANGLEGMDAVLQAVDPTLNVNAFFGDWVVANYIDDPNALGMDGIYGYRKFEQNAPVLEGTFTQFPVEVARTTVSNYATDYYLLEGEGDLAIDFSGQNSTALTGAAAYSGQFAWWGNRVDDSDSRLTRHFDLSAVAPGTPIEMDVAMWWNIEIDYDYGYVLASRDGVKWDPLEGQNTTTRNPSGNSFGSAYTGKSVDQNDRNYDTADPGWLIEKFDLSPYAGEEIFIRFEYVTDDAVNQSGWLIDDIRIPAIGYATDFESGTDEWQSEGWLRTDNVLPQRWLLQVIELKDNALTNVIRVSNEATGRETININGLGNGKTAVLAISALAAVSTEPAEYEIQISRSN